MDLDVAKLCEAHYDEIARFVKRFRIDPHTADDIVQQTFEEAFRCRATYDPTRATTRAWLFGIAVNLKGRYFRHRRATDRAYELAAMRLDPPGDEWVQELIDRLDARARRDAIDKALESLPKPQLDVLALYAWTELTQREIAAALEIPEGTVKSCLSTLDDLRVPPGNRLEKLKGDRAGTYSIRINRQWRICFRWTAAGPEHAEIVDYH